MIKQAMILAAGLGTRMRPLTDILPKPMINLCNKPLIEYAIDKLQDYGIEKIVVNTSYKAEIIEDYLKNSFSDIVISREAAPLETGGGIAKALHNFDQEAFFSINSDVIWLDFEYPTLNNLADNFSDDIDILLLLFPTDKAIGYQGNGDFFLQDNGYLRRRQEHEKAPYIYTGIQILRKNIFSDIPQGAFSLNLLYNRAMQASPQRIKGIVHKGDLLNVGDLVGKQAAEEFFSHRD